MSNKKDQLRPYVRGSLVGLAVGDALGMPVETMTHEEIMAATSNHGITDYVAPIQGKFKTQRTLLPGQWTDDTQLTLAVAKSLIRSKGFDLDDQARAHVEALAETTSGWGKTTRLAIEQIRDGLRKAGDPPPTGPKLGSGNGVAMKIAPLAIFVGASRTYDREIKFESDVFRLGFMTHRSWKASLGALFIGDAVLTSISSLIARLEAHELPPKWWTPRGSVDRGVWKVEEVDEIQRGVLGSEKSFRETWPKMARVANLSSDSQELRLATGMKFHVVDTVCYAIGVASRHAFDFETAILEAVNGGGDADTNAAMVGAIVGARVGIDGIPKRWLDGLYHKDEVIAVADELLDAASS